MVLHEEVKSHREVCEGWEIKTVVRCTVEVTHGFKVEATSGISSELLLVDSSDGQTDR